MPEETSAENLARRKWERDAYLDKMGDRTRTLCLGTVALIWGIFGVKSDKSGLLISRGSKVGLLCVALSAIVVLAMELAEYFCAYHYRRRLAGEKVWDKIAFNRWEKRMRIWRIGLGAITVIALCLILGCIAVSTAFGQNPPQYPYAGKWCGGGDAHHACLSVSNSSPTITVQINLAGINDDKWIPCVDVSEAGGDLTATCKTEMLTFYIDVSGGSEEDEVDFALRDVNGSSPTRTLVLQPD